MKRNIRVYFELLLIIVTTQVYASQNRERPYSDYTAHATEQNKPTKGKAESHASRMIYSEKRQVSTVIVPPVKPVQSGNLAVSDPGAKESVHYYSTAGKAHSMSSRSIVSRKKLFQLKESKHQILNDMKQIAITPERKELFNEVSVRLNSIDRLMTSIHQAGANSRINQRKLDKIKKELTEEEKKLKELEKKLNEMDDAELIDIDLQSMLKKQQKTIQMLSGIAKMLHDTATTVIRHMN